MNAELCEWLIDTFENSDKQDIKDDIMNFSQYNFTTDRANVLDGEEKHQEIVDCLQKILKEYLKDVEARVFPKIGGIEELRVKRYLKNSSQEFKLHIDNADKDSSCRALAFLFYLNDSDGDTVFPSHGLAATPVQGSVLIFPPTWEYPHIGKEPKEKDKYIMSTYLHYG